ncbi:hypothetical protein PBY51_002432 [Eleginops maclovinus]|uniref:Uncharacterized protein n=1 Tax=Eleginops maclovinus TaxID=56733 RepID=A0AAN7XCX5_ELEMC|nr:hypothetical protein PBY51_002432 [Eleginops maclovinus]
MKVRRCFNRSQCDTMLRTKAACTRCHALVSCEEIEKGNTDLQTVTFHSDTQGLTVLITWFHKELLGHYPPNPQSIIEL